MFGGFEFTIYIFLGGGSSTTVNTVWNTSLYKTKCYNSRRLLDIDNGTSVAGNNTHV